MKFLIPNYSCLQKPWLGGYRPQIPVLSVLCPHLNLLNPPPNKIAGYATGFTCWIPKATNTNSEYAILIAFPLRRWLLRLWCSACIVMYNSDESPTSCVFIVWCVGDKQHKMGKSVVCTEWRRATQGARNESCSFCAGQNVYRANGFLKIFQHAARATFLLCGEEERFSKSGLN